jgi:hypothetical protein
MKTRTVIVLGMLAWGCSEQVSTPASAPSKSPLETLRDRFGFNWFNNPNNEKCVRIDDALLKDFQENYQCNLEERTNSASGNPHVSCSRKDKTREYTIFRTEAHCQQELETQQANSEH